MENLIKKTKVETDIIIKTTVLNTKKDIKLLKGYEEDNNSNKKRYMRNYAIMIENEFITSNVTDSMLFIYELSLFDRGDEQNTYFQLTSRKMQKRENISLKLTLASKKEIFITRSEAKAIVRLCEMSFIGFSGTQLFENEIKHTEETWTLALKNNGFMD